MVNSDGDVTLYDAIITINGHKTYLLPSYDRKIITKIVKLLRSIEKLFFAIFLNVHASHQLDLNFLFFYEFLEAAINFIYTHPTLMNLISFNKFPVQIKILADFFNSLILKFVGF